jgi:hypothetical protein
MKRKVSRDGGALALHPALIEAHARHSAAGWAHPSSRFQDCPPYNRHDFFYPLE